jgi:hypothetical protein
MFTKYKNKYRCQYYINIIIQLYINYNIDYNLYIKYNIDYNLYLRNIIIDVS